MPTIKFIPRASGPPIFPRALAVEEKSPLLAALAVARAAARWLTLADLARLNALGVTPLASGSILNACDLKNGAVPQNQIAVYAMISAKQKLKGKWKFLDMYKEAEEIAE